MPVPVVLIHGLRGGAIEWRLQRSALEAAGHRVIVPDLPGHGTRQSEPFTLGESLVSIAEAATTVGTPVALIGRGLGAHLAIEYASLTPALGTVPLIRGLVAIACGTQPLSWILDSYRIASASHQVLPDRGAALSSLASENFLRSGGMKEPAGSSEIFADALRQLGAIDTVGALPRIAAPVWLLNGQFDRFRLQERAFLRAARHGLLIRQARTRLASSLSRPRETNRLLLGVLAEIDRRHPAT